MQIWDKLISSNSIISLIL